MHLNARFPIRVAVHFSGNEPAAFTFQAPVHGLEMRLFSLSCPRIPFQSDVRHASRIAFHPSGVLIGKCNIRPRNRLNCQACGPNSLETRRALPRIEVSRFDFDSKRLGRSQAEDGSRRCAETAWGDDLVYPRLSEAMLNPALESLDCLKDLRSSYTGTLTCFQSTARSPRLRSHGSLNRQISVESAADIDVGVAPRVLGPA